MYDVIIVGSGGAGLTAALSAKQEGKEVLVITKTLVTHSQTCQAQGGINAVLYENEDSIEQHINDTYKASLNLASKQNIKYLCEHAKDAIIWLNKIGVPFSRDENNQISQRKFGGTKMLRTCYSSDYTGLKILQTLYDKCLNEKVEFLEEHILLDLIMDEYKISCAGVTILDIKSSELKDIHAKSIILATGGYAGIYSNKTTNSTSNTADGLAIAYKNKVELSNMEFVQFHPTTLKHTNILISESARGEGGFLLDCNKERFIDELTTRDKVSRAIYKKQSDNNDVYLDLRHLGSQKIKEIMPQERDLAKEFSNILIEEEILPIEPASHYSMGGIKVDINGQTNIKNLYALGECAQANIHGANRLGGNSLLELIVMGKTVGAYAAKNHIKCEYQIKSNIEDLNVQINTLLTNDNCLNFYEDKNRLADMLFSKVGLFRSKDSLYQALDQVRKLRDNIDNIGINDKSKVYNKNLIDYIEYKNTLDIAKVTILSAIHRKESRGSHFRVDYENTDEELNLITTIKLNDGIDCVYYEDIK